MKKYFASSKIKRYQECTQKHCVWQMGNTSPIPCKSLWMTVWYAHTLHLLFCVDDCLVCTHSALVILCGWLSGMHTLYTCYSVWMTVWYAHTLHLLFCVVDCLVCTHSALVILCGWLSGMQTLCTCYSVWMTVWYAHTLHTRQTLCIPDIHPHRITSTKHRINTVVSLDDGPIVTQNM